MTWRLYIETTIAQALGTYIRTYSIFKNKHLSANIKLIMYGALIRSIMTNACPTGEFVADTHLMKLQCCRIELSVLLVTYRHTPICDLHMVFKIPYMYD
jgi:hypothetical protein